MGLLDRLTPRRPEIELVPGPPVPADDPVFATKALRKLLTSLPSNESRVLLDLGPVVGSNVSFFGERFGCKIFVEDIFADLERHLRSGTAARFPLVATLTTSSSSKLISGSGERPCEWPVGSWTRC